MPLCLTAWGAVSAQLGGSEEKKVWQEVKENRKIEKFLIQNSKEESCRDDFLESVWSVAASDQLPGAATTPTKYFLEPVQSVAYTELSGLANF